MTNLFKPKTPEVQPPAVMPDRESPAALEAERRAQNDVMTRRGRTSTILSDAMRGGDYSGRNLGAN
jgi:hypothetical protein